MAAAGDGLELASSPRVASDLGRRLRSRRDVLGDDRHEVAERAGMADSYLRYLEEEASNPSPETLRTLARALSTTTEVLLGGTAEQARGSAPAPDAQLDVLGEAECWELLRDQCVARVAFVVDGAVVVLPVNYVVTGRTVLIRTACETALAESVSSDGALSVQVDRFDEGLGAGWSVLLRGHGHRLDPDADAESPVSVVQPWAGPGRTFLIGFHTDDISGRRICVG